MSPTHSSGPLVDLQSLRYRYPEGPEIAFEDLHVEPGQHLLLRGASGSGKSTLLALMAGLLSASSGRVLMAGQDLQALRPSQRDAWRGAALGFVPQRLHLSAALTVRGNLELPFIGAGLAVDQGRIDALMDRLGLAALDARMPHRLSVGQAQRVALARALVRRPKLLLADEPSASLDDASTAQVLELLREAAEEEGATLILATHDARVAARSEGFIERVLSPC